MGRQEWGESQRKGFWKLKGSDVLKFLALKEEEETDIANADEDIVFVDISSARCVKRFCQLLRREGKIAIGYQQM